jgi:hypothetical protein
MLLSFFESGDIEVSIFDSLDSDLKIILEEVPCKSFKTDYLEFIEYSKPLDLSFLYAVVKRKEGGNKKIYGVFYFQQLKFTEKNIQLKNSLFYSFLSKTFLKIRPVKILICGNILAVNFPSLYYDPSKINQAELIEISLKIARQFKSDIFILKDMSDDFTEAKMLEFGLKKYPTDLTMTLTFKKSWNTFSDYLQNLSKKYRKRTEKILENGKNLSRKELSLEEMQKESNTIDNLFAQVRENQVIKMGLVNSDYLIEYKKRFPEIFSLWGYFFENKMIGFATYIDRNNALEMHYLGIDYAFNKRFNIYFNMLLDGLKKAFEMKKDELELGRTAREAKANIGCKPVYFNDYYYIKGKITSFLVTKILNSFSKEMGEKWSERHPFNN